MEHYRTLIHGLNYRIDDHEAKPGQCRVLENVYPSGPPDAPVWKPALKPAVMLATNKDRKPIKSAYVWHRANLPSLLIVLAYSENTGTDMLYSFEMGADGSIPASAVETTLYAITDEIADREAAFAQTGDNLIVSIGTPARAEKMLWVTMIDGAVACVDFNVNVPFPEITVDTSVSSAKNTPGLDFSHVYFAVRMAWELLDGTLLGISGALIIDVTPKSTSPTVWPIIKFTATQLSFSDANWKRLIRGLVLYMSPYASDQVIDPEEYLVRESMFYRIGILESVFTGSPSYTFDEEWDTITTLERLESDVLISRKSMLAKALFSYNKRVLYGAIEYLFNAPSRLDGKVETGVGVPTLTYPKPSWLLVAVVTVPSSAASTIVHPGSFDNLYRFAYKNTLSWDMPDLPEGVTFSKIAMQRRISFTYKKFANTGTIVPEFIHERVVLDANDNGGWKHIGTSIQQGEPYQTDDAPEYTDDSYFDFKFSKTGSFGTGTGEDVYNITFEYRIKALYSNGESGYTDAVLTPVGTIVNPLPVTALELAVSGGQDFFNDLLTVQVGKLEALAEMRWILPDENDTKLKIAAIHIERSWSYSHRVLTNGNPYDPVYNDQNTFYDFAEVASLPPSTTVFQDEVVTPAVYLQKGEGYLMLHIEYKVIVEYEKSDTRPEASVSWSANA
jgi:hypothetical protein